MASITCTIIAVANIRYCGSDVYMQTYIRLLIDGPRQSNLVLISYASSEGSGEPAHLRSLARTSAARSYKQ